ncbi:MAG: histone-like nucleoid-structuring protein Lsr2 [Propionibacteriaceae bacterium]|nr:histone-like nucleoid-structuring protein Lsr2 [Propionibacteriaceae bacterium]
MAVKTLITDDHSGIELPAHGPHETIRVVLGDLQWADVHLGAESADKLEQLVTEFLQGKEPVPAHYQEQPARRSGQAAASTVSASPEEKREQRQRIRDFVENSDRDDLQGIEVSDRGRIPKNVLDAFYQEHPRESRLF